MGATVGRLVLVTVGRATVGRATVGSTTGVEVTTSTMGVAVTTTGVGGKTVVVGVGVAVGWHADRSIPTIMNTANFLIIVIFSSLLLNKGSNIQIIALSLLNKLSLDTERMFVYYSSTNER